MPHSALIISIAAIVFISIIVLYIISIYNELVSLKNNIKKNWANIDVLLKKRHDELSKLIDTCKQYMGYESNTLQNIVQARETQQKASQAGDIKQIGKEEGVLKQGLANLKMRAEAYPDLKASTSFQQLTQAIDQLESSIAARREYYNDSVNINNTTIEQFPTNIMANLCHFKHATLLEFTDAEKQDMNVDDLFKA